MRELFYFLVAIMIIVTLHEFGHYAVARYFRVKVERFSIGFGKVLWRKMWRDTEWCVSLIPLGGYVRMTDTRNGEVASECLPYAFDLQAAWKRILIYLAGPMVNFILGVLLLSVVFYNQGITRMQPQVYSVIVDSLADKAGFEEGDLVLTVNQQPVKDFSELSMVTMENLESSLLRYEVKDSYGQDRVRTIQARDYPTRIRKILLGKSSFGFSPYQITNQIEKVIPGGPASRAGLQEGDIILALNGQSLANYRDFSRILRSHPSQKVEVLYKRDKKIFTAVVIPDSVQEIKDSEPIGQIGIQNKINETLAKKNQDIYHPSLLNSVRMAIDRTGHILKQTLVFLGKMLVGKSSWMNLSGPITTANYASQTAAMGLASYLTFLALISISIGVLNLLPIPVLDGGGALFSLIEWIRGKPINERVQEFATKFGFLLVVLLTFIAFSNDFIRILDN